MTYVNFLRGKGGVSIYSVALFYILTKQYPFWEFLRRHLD